MLIGLPGSGKSALAQQLVTQQPKKSQGNEQGSLRADGFLGSVCPKCIQSECGLGGSQGSAVLGSPQVEQLPPHEQLAVAHKPLTVGKIISTDAIRAQLFGNERIQGSWLLIWDQVKRQFNDAVAQIRQEQILNAIYDATNVVRKKRKEAIYLARTSGFTHITGIWLDTPLQVCLERNQNRDRFVPEDVILQMDRHLQAAPPNLEDGLDELIYYPFPTSTEIALSLKRKNRTESS